MLLRHGPQIKTLKLIEISIYQTFDFLHQQKETGKKGGGIPIYLKKDIKFKIIEVFSVSDDNNRCVAVDLFNLFPYYDFGENYRENDQNDSLQSSY